MSDERQHGGAPGAAGIDDDELFEREMAKLDLRPPPPRRAERPHTGRAAELAPTASEDDLAPEDALFVEAMAGLDEDTCARTGAARAAAVDTASPALGSSKSLRRRVRAGEVSPELTLDLHGLRREEAYRALQAFVRRGLTERRRVLMVISGRGLHSTDRAVLQEAVAEWLRHDLQPDVREALPAPPAQGGRGAWFVFLREA